MRTEAGHMDDMQETLEQLLDKYGSSQKLAWGDDQYGVSWQLKWT
jgi:predicted 3-demethylubiquinone-9 3-methyltransferase (glyoxalase superfamily)